MSILDALTAILPGIAKLIENAIGDSYDKEAEKQAMLDMSRALADARVDAVLANAPTVSE